MGKINAEWHRANPMPKNPTMDQRLAWHVAHAAACACREELPGSIVAEMKRRGMAVPRTVSRNHRRSAPDGASDR